MAHRFKPLIGITLGDPAGIGPEIIVKMLAEKRPYTLARPLVIGDMRIVKRALRFSHLALDVVAVASPREVQGRFGLIEVLDLKNIEPEAAPPGTLSALCGRAAVEAVFKGIDLAMAGEIDGVVTAPLNKEAMQLAGFSYPGHTELFAERTGTRDYALMLVLGRLRVLHVSTHCSLREACERVKKERVLQVIRLAERALHALGIKRPKIAVAGLNPHAGEKGLFGREEIEEIIPAIEQARAEGILALGPYPPDTLFLRAKKGEFDGVVAMYHDQGHIPLKLLGFDRGVNVTVGLPIIRTSVDHGTAFDIAGTGTANPRSLVEAFRWAARMAKVRGASGATGG